MAESSDMESAKKLAKAGAAVLVSGGSAIKVETAGKAFEKQQWLAMAEVPDEAALYEMSVLDVLVGKNKETFSCGMQNLGLKDTMLVNEDFETGYGLVRLFNIYRLIDKPVIKENETFTPTAGASTYLIENEDNPSTSSDELFFNPYGMWKLTQLK
jgi:hypothetical protein